MTEIIENFVEKQKETIKPNKKIDDDSFLIFCFGISWSMCQSYEDGNDIIKNLIK